MNADKLIQLQQLLTDLQEDLTSIGYKQDCARLIHLCKSRIASYGYREVVTYTVYKGKDINSISILGDK